MRSAGSTNAGSTNAVPQRQPRDAGNIVLAVVLTVVVGALVASLAVASTSASRSTSSDRSYTLAVHNADAGVQQALYQLNRNRLAANNVLAGIMNAGGSGTAPGGSYSWTAQPGSGTWTITSTGTYGGRTRTVVVTADRTVRFPDAVFTDRNAKLVGNNLVSAYDSANGLGPPLVPGAGSVGSNGTISAVGASTTADGGTTLYDYGSDPDPRRCAGSSPVCAAPAKQFYPSDVTSENALSFITNKGKSGGLDKCKASLLALPEWIASRDGGTGTTAVFPNSAMAGPFCYSRIVFDRDTVLAPGLSAHNPAVVYVEQSVTTGPQVRVNAAPGVLPVSSALQIYTTTTGAINWGAQSTFAAALYAPKAECGEKSGGGVTLYGSIVCGAFNSRGGWRIYYDVGLRAVGSTPFAITSWEES